MGREGSVFNAFCVNDAGRKREGVLVPGTPDEGVGQEERLGWMEEEKGRRRRRRFCWMMPLRVA